MKTKKIIYYYDRIIINSFIPLEELKDLLPLKKLHKNCNNTKKSPLVRRPSPLAVYHGYESTIDAYQVNDKFLAILKEYDIGKYGIARIEIAKDYVFRSRDESFNFLDYFINYAVKLYSRNLSFFTFHEDKGYFDYLKETDFINSRNAPSRSLYLGKKMGKTSSNYIVAYMPEIQ